MYAMLMMVVLVGMVIEINEEGVCSPTASFFLGVVALFIIAALLHPQEWRCLVYGMVYYVSIPSMYMLLMIFAITNMNNISWGTRENPPTTQQGTQSEGRRKKVGIFATLKVN